MWKVWPEDETDSLRRLRRTGRSRGNDRGAEISGPDDRAGGIETADSRRSATGRPAATGAEFAAPLMHDSIFTLGTGAGIQIADFRSFARTMALLITPRIEVPVSIGGVD